jgi:hypothetical protein
MKCGKRVYVTKKEARRVRRILNKKRNTLNGGVKYKAPYYCDDCSAYHLSTKGKMVLVFEVNGRRKYIPEDKYEGLCRGA